MGVLFTVVFLVFTASASFAKYQCIDKLYR
jgi:hypothetical protein